MPSGGLRPGAGRKPNGPAPLKPISIRLSAEDIASLKVINPNVSEAIRALIARHSKE